MNTETALLRAALYPLLAAGFVLLAWLYLVGETP